MQSSDKPVMVVADFDDTLLTVDSLCSIMKKDRWYLDPAMLMAGGRIVLAKALGRGVLEARSRFKWLMLGKYRALPESGKAAWIAYFREHVNKDVLGQIEALHPAKVVIASASEEGLIVSVLDGILKTDDVIANVFTEDPASFRTCYGRWKADRFAERHPERKEYRVVVFTDSESDRPLMNLADEVRLVRKAR